MTLALFLIMTQTLFVQVQDPSGHHRSLKWRDFPMEWGTDLQSKTGLRDPLLGPAALRIEAEQGDYRLRVLQPGLNLRVGDLKVQSLQIPLGVPITIGHSELVFTSTEPRPQDFEFPKGEQGWFTESESGRHLLIGLRKAAGTRLSIHLSGETGTGKEVLAKLAHLWSERASGPFVPINCGAVALSLAESELFGHVKGAFTGAHRDRPGALLQAHGGTLFLDEVGDLPPELQVKLLRFLECGEIRPVGSDRVLHADVRIICATHKPLQRMVAERKFRQDLYYRLASIPVEIPSLRSRPEDVRALGIRFARNFDKTLTPEAVTRLQLCSWPGNVRELRHAIERACGGAGPDQGIIHAADLDFLQEDAARSSTEAGVTGLNGVGTLEQMEKIMILRALRIANGNRTDTARILGVARSTLFEMMKRHSIVGPRSNDYGFQDFEATRRIGWTVPLEQVPSR